MVAAFDYCLHGRGGAAPSIDTAMHGLVDARARRPPAPRLRHRVRHRGRRRGADQGVLRRPGALGAVAAARASSSAWTSPRSSGTTRRRSASSSAGTASPPGARPATSARRTRWRSSPPPSVTSTSAAGRSRSAPMLPGYAAAARDRAARAGRAALAPVIRGLASHRPAAGRALHRHPGGARLPGPREASARWPRSARPAPITSCAPRSARWCSTCPPAAPLDEVVDPAARSCTPPTATTTGPTTSGTRTRTRRRCAAPTRRSCWCPGSACSASARTSRPRGWPASSTSTRST